MSSTFYFSLYKFLRLIIILLVIPLAGQGQPEIPILPKSGKSLEEFVPNGWKILTQQTGDLNKDAVPDKAFVIQDTNQKNFDVNGGFGDDTVNLNPRVLAIYFGSQNGTFAKQHQADKFIPLKDSPTLEEPFDGISITNQGVLQIDFHFWTSAGSWSTSSHSYKFRYQNDRFELIGYDSSDMHRGTGETTEYSINFSIRKMRVIKGHISEDKPRSDAWKSFKLPKLQSLESMEEPFRWEFEGIYL